ncbi:MAG: RloB domain-containing protein [Spirochaetales bacterium]|nr:RloB domain-containing protein [Candidatus Physcosoma equi]
MTVRKKSKVEAKGSMLMVCATDAEVTFFSQLRKDCRYSNLTIVKAQASSLQKFLSEAGSLRSKGKYTSVWCVFGYDELETTAEEVSEAKETAEKKRLNMLYFDPSFDLYFALHEVSPRKIMTKEDLARRVAAAYEGYELTAQYFLTKGANMNFMIYPKLAVADQNARSYDDLVEINTGYKATTLPEFLDDLKTVCGKADMSHTRNRF